MSSDVESVISEDVSIVSDASDLYDPDQAELENAAESPKHVKQENKNDFRQKQDTVRSSSGLGGGRLPVSHTADVGSAGGADQSDEYSAAFDDFENDDMSEAYSYDFSDKRDATALPQKPRIGRQTTQVSEIGGTLNRTQAKSSIATINAQIPSLGMHTLEAEAALDEISKEVVRLRNQQRTVLRERRLQAKEKKARAESRRAQYETELKSLRERVHNADADSNLLREKVSELERRAENAVESRNLLVESKRLLEEEVQQLRTQVGELNQELFQVKQAAAQRQQELEVAMTDSSSKWVVERAELRMQVQKGEQLLEVMHQHMHDREARYAQEREKLPDHYQRIVDEQLARVTALEAAAKDREGALRSEEAFRLASAEKLRNDMLEEVTRHRMKVEADLAEERGDLSRSRAALDATRAQWELQRSQQISDLETRQMHQTRREKALEESMAALEKQRIELDLSKRMIEPNVQAAERFLVESRSRKARADELILAAEQRESLVLAAERGLIKREQAAVAAQQAADDLLEKMSLERRTVALDAGRLREAKQAIDKEKFRLHQVSMELAAQTEVVKRSIRHVQSADQLVLRNSNRDNRDRSDFIDFRNSSSSLTDEDASPSEDENRVAGMRTRHKRHDHDLAHKPSLMMTASALRNASHAIEDIITATANYASHAPTYQSLQYQPPFSFAQEQELALSLPLPSAPPSPPRSAPNKFNSAVVLPSENRGDIPVDAGESLRAAVLSATQTAKTLRSFAATHGLFS